MPAIHADIRELELELKLIDGSEQEYEYKRKNGRVSAKVKIQDKEGRKTKKSGQEAISATEQLLSELAPTEEMSSEQLISRVHSALHVKPEMIDRLEIEVEFNNGAEIKAKAHGRKQTRRPAA
ncbi:MAG TPA: YusW family protein [Candidatus Limnocylindrales bacterium]|nr:YusW family protein [Candidatus Limnocylindrales bacterium]